MAQAAEQESLFRPRWRFRLTVVNMYVHVRPRVLVIARGLVAERARTQARGEAALIKILRLMWLTPLLSQVLLSGPD